MIASLLIIALTNAQPGLTSPDSEESAVTFARPIEIEAGASYGWMSNDIANWNTQFLEVSRALGRQSAFYGVARQSRRFELSDLEVISGLSFPLHERWTTACELSFSPTHRIAPQWSALVGEYFNFVGGWVYGIDLRMARYEPATVARFIQSLELYWGRFRGAYSLSLNTLWGDRTVSSHQVTLNYYYATRNSFGISYAMGSELERFGLMDILSNHIVVLSLVGRHWVVPTWAISYEWGWNEMLNHYSQTGVRIGLRHEF